MESENKPNDLLNPAEKRWTTLGCVVPVIGGIIFFVLFVWTGVSGSSLFYPIAWLFIAWVAVSGVFAFVAKSRLRKLPDGLPGAPPVNPTLDIPESDEVVIACGYDYLTESYKIWMSPVVHLPSTRGRMDTYLSVVEVTQREYTSRQESFPDVDNAVERLQDVGWKVEEVHPVELLKHLPYWVSESGGPKSGRSAIMDRENNSGSEWNLRYHTDESDAPLRDDLKVKVRERERQEREKERQAREDAEFKKAMKPLPDWVSHPTIAGSMVDELNAKEDFPLSDIDEYVIFYGGDVEQLSDHLPDAYAHESADNLDQCNAWLFGDRSVLLYNPISSGIVWSEGDIGIAHAMIGYANFVLDEMYSIMGYEWGDDSSMAGIVQQQLSDGQSFNPLRCIMYIKSDEGNLELETQVAYLYWDGSVIERTSEHYRESQCDRKDRILDAMRQKARRLDSGNR